MADGNVREAIITHLARLGLFGLGGHIIWSAFVGLGLGISAESTKTGWAKWKPFIIYYLVAAVSHSVFDLGGSVVGMLVVGSIQRLMGIATDLSLGNMGEFGPLNNSMRYGTYVWNLVFLIILIVQIRRSFGKENTIQVDELSSKEKVVMREEELEQLKAEKLFSKRRYKEYPRPVSNKLVLYQNLLAMQKHTAKQLGKNIDEIESVVAFRRSIRQLRSG